MKQRARKLTSWLLTLAMCLSMVPAFSLSALADDFVASVGTKEYTTLADALTAWADGTTLTLLADAETASTITVSSNETKTLDLNGFGIKRVGSDDYSVITVSEGASLTLNDSNPSNDSGNRPDGVIGGYITGGNARFGGGVNNVGTFIMNGGTITGNTTSADGYGGGVYSNGGTFTMTGGTISDNTATSLGGGVYSTSGTFSMEGGTITGNTANTHGGGVSNYGTFIMSGGTITGNTASTNGGGVYNYNTFNLSGGTIIGNTGNSGGGVYNDGRTFTMTGGTISDNTASFWGGGGVWNKYGTFTMTDGTISGNTGNFVGGGVYNESTFNLSGAPSITGNTAKSAANNVEVDTAKALNVTAALTDGARVGVSTVGTFADGGSYTIEDTDAAKFTSDKDGYIVKLENNQLALVEPVTGPDLTLALTADSGTVTPGGTFNVTVALRNSTGAAKTVSALDVTFPTSEDYTLGAFTKDSGVTGALTKSDSSLTFHAGGSAANNLTIPANDTVTLGTLSVTADANLSNRENITVAANTNGTYHLYQNDAVLQLGAENAVKGLAYTVTFDSNGGSEVETQTVAHNGTATAPTAPTKDGYRFLGWDFGGIDYDFTTPVTQNITLVALWQEQKTVSLDEVDNATVTLDYDDGDGNPQTVNEGESAAVDTGTPVTVNVFIDQMDAYEVTSVMYGNTPLDLEGGDTYYFTATDSQPVTVTVSPIDYTFTYDTNGGDTMPSLDYTIESVGTFPTPTRTGYTFQDWRVTTADGNWWEGETYESDQHFSHRYGNVTLTAQWTATEYNVTYALGGGTVAAENPATYTIETPDFTLNNPTKNGYTFAGWTGTGLSAATQSVTVAQGSTENRTYTATWTPIDYTVTYALDGGTNQDGAVTAYTVESTATLPTPTRTGFTFTGWKVTAADGSWTADEIVGGGTSLTNRYGNVTLTAQWSLNAKVVFADYAYAGTGYKLLLVGANPGESKMLTYDGQSMFKTNTASYLALVNTNNEGYTSVYVYIVEASETMDSATAKLGVADGANAAVNRNGDLDTNDTFNSNDWGIVNDMLADANYTAGLSVQRRLSADVDSSDAESHFGSIRDIEAILNSYYTSLNN